MRFVVFIALVVACFAGEPRLITFTKPILLTPKERKDHSHVVIEVFSKGTTNKAEIVTTSRLITLHDMEDIPDGHAFFVVRSVLTDGQESLKKATDIFVDRGSPEPPTVGSIKLTKDESEIVRTYDDLMFARRKARGITNAPMPTIPNFTNTFLPGISTPLPHATNRAYREDLRRSE